MPSFVYFVIYALMSGAGLALFIQYWAGAGLLSLWAGAFLLVSGCYLMWLQALASGVQHRE
jgi:hypothetical protein